MIPAASKGALNSPANAVLSQVTAKSSEIFSYRYPANWDMLIFGGMFTIAVSIILEYIVLINKESCRGG